MKYKWKSSSKERAEVFKRRSGEFLGTRQCPRCDSRGDMYADTRRDGDVLAVWTRGGVSWLDTGMSKSEAWHPLTGCGYCR